MDLQNLAELNVDLPNYSLLGGADYKEVENGQQPAAGVEKRMKKEFRSRTVSQTHSRLLRAGDSNSSTRDDTFQSKLNVSLDNSVLRKDKWKQSSSSIESS